MNNFIRISLLLFCLTAALTGLKAQAVLPGNGFLYDDTGVGRIDITIDARDLDAILMPGNESSDIEYLASFKMTRGLDVRTIDSVGLRLRGNTSRRSAKKSFKVSVNSFVSGQKFDKVEKINLNGEHNDPSIARAKICWDLFRLAGVPAPRASHVELYINQEYRGLYINVEHIDENFAKLRFGNNDGNLYKCLWPADLDYRGANPNLYKFESGNRRAYALTRNEDLDDYTDLANFIDIINNVDPANFQEKLEPVFEINSYLKVLAVEILAGHWDDYSYNMNNYYLYRNEESGRFEYIPYDTDNSFGIDWFNIDWAKRDVYSWFKQDANRPLTEFVLQNKTYRDRFTFFMNRFLDEYYNLAYLEPRVNSLRDEIEPFTVNDLYRTYDYGYTYDDFYNSFNLESGSHVKYGIIPFVNQRYLSAKSQLESVNIAPVISRVKGNHPGINENFVISAQVEDEETPQAVKIYFSSGGEYSSVDMQSIGNDIYQAIIPGFSISGKLDYYLEAEDILSQTGREPFAGDFTISVGTAVAVPEYYSSSTSVSVYPNPFVSWFEISCAGECERINYKLFDIGGKKVFEGTSRENHTRVFTDEFTISGGIYFLHLEVTGSGNTLLYRENRKMIFMK